MRTLSQFDAHVDQHTAEYVARLLAHAPNESTRLSDSVEGIKVIGRLIELFAEA